MTIKKIKAIMSWVSGKKNYFLPGLYLFSFLFLISFIMNLSISYMGNKNTKVAGLIFREYLSLILYQVIKIYLVYALLGILLSIIFYRAFLELNKRFSGLKNIFPPFRSTIIFIFLFVILTFFKKIIINPQLYIENFAQKASLFQDFQYFLTDNVNPLVPGIGAWLLLAGAIVLCLLSIDRQALKNIISPLFNQAWNLKRYLLPAFGAVIIFLILYQCRIIFYNKTEKPNILFISSDAVRPDHLSLNGYFRKTTPSIDALGEKSVQFRKVITTVPRTFPSWVSILTSTYPLSHDIKHMFPRTRERNRVFKSLPSYLNEKGYSTALISDFAGDIFPRIDLGFNKTEAPDTNFRIVIKQILLERQTFLLPFITNRIGRLIFSELKGLAKYSCPELLTQSLKDEIDSQRGNPFFITVFYSITHFPFSSPYPYYKKYGKKDYQGPYKYYKQLIIRMEGSESDSETIRSEDKEQIVSLYDGCLNLMDMEIGDILNFLEERELLDNTILVFTSDHGENLYEKNFGIGHGDHVKADLSLEVPLVIHYISIDKELSGKTFQKLSSTIDIAPTVLDAAKIEIPPYFDGKSMLASIGKESQGEDVEAYSESGIWFDNNKRDDLFFQHQRIDYPDISGISEADSTYKDEVVIRQRFQNIINFSKHRTIYSGKYKLIYMPLKNGPKFELYDHIADPDNDKDLSVQQGYILEKMKKKFYDFVDEKSYGNFLIKKGLLFPAFSDPIF